MAQGTRARMVTAAAELFRDRGYDGTGFRDVVDRAGTARGVIYHHFPHGKSELGVEVVAEMGDRIASRVEQACRDHEATEALSLVLDAIERSLVRGSSRPGCPVVAVILAADDPGDALRSAGRSFFTRLRTAVQACLEREGVDAGAAEAFAALAVASAEGAVILCRADRSTAPFRLVRASLVAQLSHLPRQATRDPSAAAEASVRI